MRNFKKSIFASIVIIAAIHALSSISAAQSIRATEISRGGFELNDDIKAYEIICKEHPEEFDDYYEMVRKRIVQRLKNNYRDDFRDGDVDLLFILNSNGTIDRIDVGADKTDNDAGLINIAKLSLQQAAPFPPFPKELSVPKMPLSLTISFKKR